MMENKVVIGSLYYEIDMTWDINIEISNLHLQY